MKNETTSNKGFILLVIDDTKRNFLDKIGLLKDGTYHVEKIKIPDLAISIECASKIINNDNFITSQRVIAIIDNNKLYVYNDVERLIMNEDIIEISTEKKHPFYEIIIV